ncbi:MAG: hypothetical protein AB1544_04840 [Pseudomonadota bacterium]|jgi:hypothetical protein
MEYALLLLLMLPPLLLTAYRTRSLEGDGALDLGVVFTWVVFVYAWFPLLGWILAQQGYGVLQDQRAIDDYPLSSEIVYVGTCYLAFLVGFALVYGWRRAVVTKSPVLIKADWLQVLTVVVGAALVLSANFLSRFLLGVEQAESYIDSYTQLRQFPLLIQQIMGVLSQIEFSILLAAMVFTIAWKPHLHRYVAIVVLGILLSAVLSGGSRTFGFLLAFAYVVCLSIYIKRFNVIQLALMAGVGLVLFVFAGVLRSGAGTGMLTLLQGGEFFSLFINSVDMLRQSAKAGGLDIVGDLYFVDFLRFIPQQVLWVEKLDPAVWYVTTYYPAYYEEGGGLAFGAITESIIGYGIAEALARGMLLGAAYAYVANRCFSDSRSPFKTFAYIWFVVMSYQALRDTTFSVFSRFVFQVLPILVLVAVSYSVIRQASMNTAAGRQNG